MRILYYSFVELDIPNACQGHTLGVLRGFSHQRCQVDALIPRPIHIRPIIPNVRFFFLWPWQFSAKGKLWVKLVSFLLMFFLCIKNSYDAIYVREMEINPGPRLCSKLFNIPLYIEINDLIVLASQEQGLSSTLVHKIKYNQNQDFKQATGLIIPSVPMRDWIIQHYDLPETKAHMLLNGTEMTNLKSFGQIRAREKMNLPLKSFCLGFVGNIYNRYDFDSILHAMIKCQNHIPELHLIIIGHGPLYDQLKTKVNKLNLGKRTIFTGYVQPQYLGKMLPAVDVGLLLLTRECSLRYGPVTTKLPTYAAYNLSVIATGFSLHGYPAELNHGLHLVAPEDPHALADMILWLYNHPEERQYRAKVLHDYVTEKLTWNYIAKEILDIVMYDQTIK